MQQLTDVRQLIANSRALFKDLHEKRSGPIPKPPPVVIDILPLQLVIPSMFHAEVQKYQLSPRSREILSRALDEMIEDYTKQFDDSCRKLTKSGTAQVQPLLPKIVEKLREGLQTHFENSGLDRIMSAVIDYAEKRPSRFTPPPPLPHDQNLSTKYVLLSTHLLRISYKLLI